MKKILYLFLLPLTLFAACTKTADKQETTNDQILNYKTKLAGTWTSGITYTHYSVKNFQISGGYIYRYELLFGDNDHLTLKSLSLNFPSLERTYVITKSDSDFYITFSDELNVVHNFKILKFSDTSFSMEATTTYNPPVEELGVLEPDRTPFLRQKELLHYDCQKQ